MVDAPRANPNKLTPATLDGVTVEYVHTTAQLTTFIATDLLPSLDSASEEAPRVIALDTEWVFDKERGGKREEDKVVTVQLAVAEQQVVYVFNIFALTDSFRAQFPESLKLVLEHPHARYVGSRVDIDMRHLENDWGVHIKNRNSHECNLAMLCKKGGWPVKGNQGLEVLAEVVLGVCCGFSSAVSFPSSVGIVVLWACGSFEAGESTLGRRA